MTLTVVLIALILGCFIGFKFRHNPVALATSFFLCVFGLSANVVAAANEVVTKDQTIVISATGITMVVGLFIPLLNGLLTKLNTTPFKKGLLTLVLNGISAFVISSIAADGTAVISWNTFFAWFVGFIASIASYAGIWKPAHLTSSYVKVPEPNGTVSSVPGKLASVGVK